MAIQKRNKKIGVKRASTWGTAVEPSINDGFFAESFSPPGGDRNIWVNEGEAGRGMVSEIEVLEYKEQTGTIGIKAYCEGIELFLAAVMGSEEDATEVQPAAVYKKTYPLSENIEDKFFSIAWDEGAELKCIPSAVFNSLNLSIDGTVKIEAGFIGDRVIVPSGFQVPSGVTYEGQIQNAFKLLNSKVYMNDAGGAEFQESDKITPTNVSISVTRGHVADKPGAGEASISQPSEQNAPSLEMSLSFPRKNTTNQGYFQDFNSGVAKKVKVVFEGPEISEGAKYEMSFFFPKLILTEVPKFGFDSPTPVELKLKTLKAVTAPTGMSYTLPYVTVQNTLNHKYLS